MIDLYEATFDTKWLDFALKLQVGDKVWDVVYSEGVSQIIFYAGV